MREEEIVTTRAETEVTERTGDLVEDGKMIEEEDTEMMSEDPGESQDGVVMTGLRMCLIVCRTWQQMLQSHCLTCQIFRTLTITELATKIIRCSHLEGLLATEVSTEDHLRMEDSSEALMALVEDVVAEVVEAGEVEEGLTTSEVKTWVSAAVVDLVEDEDLVEQETGTTKASMITGPLRNLKTLMTSEEEVAGEAKEAEVVEEEVLERSETGIKIMEDK